MNSVTFAYLVHAFCSGIITINPKTFILSNLLLIFAYMLSYRVFMNTGYSIFGVGTKFYDFFFFEHTLIFESKFIHILIYSILSLGFVVIKKLVKNMKQSNNFTNDVNIK